MTAEGAIFHLRRLWQQAFGDSEETLDAFFSVGFSPNRCCYICDDGVPVSALYWFDCDLAGYKLAYIYAVATEKAHRSRGLARKLMEKAHRLLMQQGYAGAILVPGEESLFSFYEKLGYHTATCISEFSCQAGDTPVALTPVSPEEYAVLRRAYLPKDSVAQESATLSYLATYARFYKGDDFLLAAAQDGDRLLVQELLGNTRAAPGILRALNLPQGNFRAPGAGRPFAMLLPLEKDCPIPTYFGLALD